MSENLNVEEINGTTRTGNFVLSDGSTIGWITDEEGDRVYFLVGEEGEDWPVIYQPIRGVKTEHILACVSLESTAIGLEEGPYGKN
jgi:hypothetical protein